MAKCDGYESRKKYVDGIWLNPKCCNNGQPAAKLRRGERSETIPQGSTPQAIGGGSGRHLLADEDIVRTLNEN